MYDIIFSDKAKKQFDNLEKDVQNRIGIKIERIKIRPFSFVKKLQNTPYYALRVGEYRVILNITQKQLIVFVVEVGHRKNVYD